MNRSFVGYTAAFAGLCLALAAVPASAAPNDFAGTWKSSDAVSSNLSRVDIRREGGELVIHVLAKCHPVVCGWGAARARLYSSNAAIPVAAGADTAIAEFERGGVQRLLVLQMANGQISYSTYTFFKNSRRNNYHTQGHMTRQ